MNDLSQAFPPAGPAPEPSPATAAGEPVSKTAPPVSGGVYRAVVAGSAAVSVALLMLGSVGLLAVAGLGIGLAMLGVPMTVVWTIVGVAGLAATVLSCRLGLDVWRYETGPDSPR